jgi:ATP phosphoribosyltransferase
MAGEFTDRRVGEAQSCTVASAGTKSTAVDQRTFRTVQMYLPAEFNSDTITFEVSNESDGTFAVLLDSTGTPVSITAAAGPRWYDLPVAVANSAFFKVVTNNAAAGAATILLAQKT